MINLILLIFALFLARTLSAQLESTPDVVLPLDGIVERSTLQQKAPLVYPPIREADILWETRIWRVLDTREKLNLCFRYPGEPLFEILQEAIESGGLTAYSAESDDFSQPLDTAELFAQLYERDTIPIFNVDTQIERYQEIVNDIDPDDIKRYRLKEVWYFDTRHSVMRVRVIGIAPMIDVTDDNGNFLYEKPLYWIYYPQARKVLAHHQVFNPSNDRDPMSWEDLFEMRRFSSHVMKESNIHDNRLQDYLTGIELLQESKKIEAEIFNMEHDMWSY
ncbi:MAG: gliding motility protein GldO [Saprospiraceae bacterium]|nr:MAG: gliding motility protein GldO [Saprospiraceae bacterium]